MRVRISKKARADLVAVVAWWRTNLGAKPVHLLQELSSARAQLAATPNAGVSVAGAPGNQRRLMLLRSRYILFYEVSADGVVSIQRVWHMSRNQPPK